MDSYEYWQHKRSGAVYAVHIQANRVVGACGPLHHSDRPDDMRDFEYSQEDGLWVDQHYEDFMLAEDSYGNR